MYFLSKTFWADMRAHPRDVLQTLRSQGNAVPWALVSAWQFLRVAISEYNFNHCLSRAAAIAFALSLSLVPLLASVAFMLASISTVDPGEVQKLLGAFLPFAPLPILHYIGEFLQNAHKIRGIGIGILIMVTVGLFGTVEEALNTIWKVRQARSFMHRLRTFTMVIVWGPLLFFGSTLIRKTVWFNFIDDHFFLVNMLPMLLSAMGFTLFIWIVPNTKVRIGSAIFGGLIADGLFELERRGYDTYVQFVLQTNPLYGTFSILPLFLFSLYLVSLFVLLGAEIAYVHQNFFPLLRSRNRSDRRVDDHKIYLALRMLIDVAVAFARNDRPSSLAMFMKRYELTDVQAQGLLQWLVDAGYLHSVNGRQQYVPAQDLMKIPVATIIAQVHTERTRITSAPADNTRRILEQLILPDRDADGPAPDGTTFEQVIAEIVKAERKSKSFSTLD